jgi:CHAT domain-containing protein
MKALKFKGQWTLRIWRCAFAIPMLFAPGNTGQIGPRIWPGVRQFNVGWALSGSVTGMAHFFQSQFKSSSSHRDAGPRGRHSVARQHRRRSRDHAGEIVSRGGTNNAIDDLAEQNFAEAERLRAEWRTESNQQAIEKLRKAFDYSTALSDVRGKVRALRGIGQVYCSLDENREAMTFLHRALALNKSVNDVATEAGILNDIGYLEFEIGDNREALRYAIQALRLSQATRDPRKEAQALYILGESRYGAGRLTEALEYLTQVLERWERLGDKDGQVKTLVSLGYTYTELGDAAKALESYNQALAISRSATDRHGEALTLRALGNLQTKLGETQHALELFLQASEILRTIDDRHLKATVLGGLGYVYDTLGEKQRALAYYEQVLSIFKDIGLAWCIAEAHLVIGKVRYSLGDNQPALFDYDTALAIFHSLKMVRREATTLAYIGLVHDSQGDKAGALVYYRRSLALTPAGQDQRYRAYTLNYIARILESFGEERRPLEYYRRALALNRDASDPLGESSTLFNMARFQLGRGNLHEARTLIDAAVRIAEALRANVASQDLRTSYFASIHQFYQLYVDVLMQLHKRQPDQGSDVLAFETSERARARSMLELLVEGRANFGQPSEESLLVRQAELQRALSIQAEKQMQLLGRRHTEVEARSVLREIDQVIAEYDSVRARIRATSPHAALTQPRPSRLSEMQQMLGDKDLLLEYSLGEARSYVWAVTRTTITAYELPSEEEIQRETRRLYELFTANQMRSGVTFAEHQARLAEARTNLAPQTRRVSEIILGPVGSQLCKRRLLIVGDGTMQYLPFQALVTPAIPGLRASEEGHLLIEDHEIIYEPSASVLLELQVETAQRKPAPKTIAVFADPVYDREDPRVRSTHQTLDDTFAGNYNRLALERTLRDVNLGQTNNQIPRLLASRDEAEAIIACVRDKMSFAAVGFQANKPTVLDPNLDQYRILHFATHGVLDSQRPELSGVILSLIDRNGDPQDGFLRLQEVCNLRLNADLVVLSACNTGLGKDVRGEGVVGLTRGFMYAGAASVMSSLWKVDDEATAELIGSFYKYTLRDGLTPEAALREAQLQLSRKPRWRDPYYWASFVIQGEYEERIQVAEARHGPLIPGIRWMMLSLAIIVGLYIVVRRVRTGTLRV